MKQFATDWHALTRRADEILNIDARPSRIAQAELARLQPASCAARGRGRRRIRHSEQSR
jgi:hypothetical protein